MLHIFFLDSTQHLPPVVDMGSFEASEIAGALEGLRVSSVRFGP